jgi:hypothetical protein
VIDPRAGICEGRAHTKGKNQIYTRTTHGFQQKKKNTN